MANDGEQKLFASESFRKFRSSRKAIAESFSRESRTNAIFSRAKDRFYVFGFFSNKSQETMLKLCENFIADGLSLLVQEACFGQVRLISEEHSKK